MKICPNCKSPVEDGAMFCGKCGTRVPEQNAAQPNYPQQPNNQFNYTQQTNNYGVNPPPYQPPVPQPQPKKKSTGLIIGIVAAVLVVLAIIGFAAEKLFQKQGYGSDGGNNSTPSYNSEAGGAAANTNASETKSYTKGSVVDGWYVNEWANLRFDTSGNWINGSAEEYAAFEGENTECGLYLETENADIQLVIGFEKLPGISSAITEEGYLDNFTIGVKEGYAESNYVCSAGEYYDKTIAGETYKCVKLTLEGNSVVQECCVRKQDGYMVVVMVTAVDNFDVDSTTNNIRTVE